MNMQTVTRYGIRHQMKDRPDLGWAWHVQGSPKSLNFEYAILYASEDDAEESMKTLKRRFPGFRSPDVTIEIVPITCTYPQE